MVALRAQHTGLTTQVQHLGKKKSAKQVHHDLCLNVAPVLLLSSQGFLEDSAASVTNPGNINFTLPQCKTAPHHHSCCSWSVIVESFSWLKDRKQMSVKQINYIILIK